MFQLRSRIAIQHLSRGLAVVLCVILVLCSLQTRGVDTALEEALSSTLNNQQMPTEQPIAMVEAGTLKLCELSDQLLRLAQVITDPGADVLWLYLPLLLLFLALIKAPLQTAIPTLRCDKKERPIYLRLGVFIE